MRTLICIIFLFLQLGCVAQRQAEYTSKVPKAVRLFESALKFYDIKQDDKALSSINEALQADSTFVEVYLLRATIYEDQKKTDKAIEAYKESLRFLPDFFPNTYYTLGNLYFGQEKYADAKSYYEKYLTYQKASAGLKYEAQLKLKSCIFADSAMKHPVTFQPVNMGDAINSTDEEYFPAITADGNTFLFTRRNKTLNEYGRKSEQEDFYISQRAGNNWSVAIPLNEVNSTGNEGAPALSSDGRYLFYTACMELDGYPGKRTGKGSCDIFLSRKDGTRWGLSRNLEEPVNTGSWESQPSFSSDGRTLYFVRRIKNENGHTHSDILVTHIGDNGQWSVPVSAGDKINTSESEMSVFIHPDDQTLYFSSNGHPGMGGLDIFYSRRQKDGTWGEPVNIGYPINTSGDENSILVSPFGEVAYFASNRSDSKGGLDIYQFNLPPMTRPQAITYMKGKVMDANSKQLLAANFELIDLATGVRIISSASDPVTGEFLIALPSGKSYALNVSRKDYLFYSDNFMMTDPKSAAEPFLKDVLMHPMKAGESIVLKNIFFATDSFALKEASKIELGKLLHFMKANPGLKIEIGGHTDNVGDKKYNQLLSEKRARSVFDYLVSDGILASRLLFKGYGDSKPVADNNSEKGRAQNRRTEFTVVSVN